VRHQGPTEAAACKTWRTRLDTSNRTRNNAGNAGSSIVAAGCVRAASGRAARSSCARSRRPEAVKAFDYRGGVLAAESVSLADIAARFGTPCFVYSRAALEDAYRQFDGAFGDAPHLVCYAMKANSNLALLNLLARLGSGFDIVSGGELARAIAAGGDPHKIVFSGVGKTTEEMHRALELGIRCFNVESASELDHLDATARQAGKRAPVSIRVNPDVDPGTHPYISTGLKDSKFGAALDDALPLYRRAAAR